MKFPLVACASGRIAHHENALDNADLQPAGGVKRYYFPVATLLLLAVTLAGFSDNLFTDIDQPSNRDPKFIVHGLFCGIWMMVLFAQTALISADNRALHRKLGIAALIVAAGVTVSTIWVFVSVWTSWAEMSPEVKSNRLFLPSYTLFVTLGFLMRKRPDWHRRLMFTGTLFMLGPALARSFDPVVVPWLGTMAEPQIESLFLPFFFGVWTAFFLSLFVYDAVVIRRIHPVTAAALPWFGAVWTIAVLT